MSPPNEGVDTIIKLSGKLCLPSRKAKVTIIDDIIFSYKPKSLLFFDTYKKSREHGLRDGMRKGFEVLDIRRK